MPDGTLPTPGGWNRFSIEVEALEPLVDALRAAGRTSATTSSPESAGGRSSSTTPRATPSSSSSRRCQRRNCRPPSRPARTVGGPVATAHHDIHPDLEAEQAYIVAAYDYLAAMQGRTGVVLRAALDDARRGDVNADAQAMHLGKRLAQLDVGGLALCFGRIDEEQDAETLYVGRRHVEDADGRSRRRRLARAGVGALLPSHAARPVRVCTRRRRFSIDGPSTCVDIFDEVFDDPDSMLQRHGRRHRRPAARRARAGAHRRRCATSSRRSRPSRTSSIRAPLDVCLVVQGGPGTGKTAVGLHRAAFLLYEHREALDRDGVLVVGPNPVFLRYIAQVCRRSARRRWCRPPCRGCAARRSPCAPPSRPLSAP